MSLEKINIGAKLRAYRHERGLSIDELARMAGLSKSFISRFERDGVQASIATLLRLCEVMDVRPGSLFETPMVNFIPAGKGAPLNLGGIGTRETVISGSGNPQMLAIHSIIAPGGGSGDESYTLQAAADLVHIIAGQLEMMLAEERYVMQAGDTLTFDPTLPHTWRNPSQEQDCVSIWIIVPPPL